MSAKLFVGNLSFQATEEDLRELFAQAGNVDTVRIITDQFTGRKLFVSAGRGPRHNRLRHHWPPKPCARSACFSLERVLIVPALGRQVDRHCSRTRRCRNGRGGEKLGIRMRIVFTESAR